MCDCAISCRSSCLTPAYQTFSGYTTIIGPWPHCEKQPALLIRTSPWRPAFDLATQVFHEVLDIGLRRTVVAAGAHEYVDVVLPHQSSAPAVAFAALRSATN